MNASTVRPTWLYRLYDADGTLLYIGITCDPKRRWKEHRREMLWWPEVADKQLTEHRSEQKAWEAERVAIAAENPLYNQSATTPPVLPAGVPPQPAGHSIAYQQPEARPAYRLEWFTWRAQLRDAYLTPQERAALGR